MDRDRKSPGLKQLQGLIWEDGLPGGRAPRPGLSRRARRDAPLARASASTSRSTRRAASSRSAGCSSRRASGDLTPLISGVLRHRGRRQRSAPASYTTIAAALELRARRDPVRLGRDGGASRRPRRRHAGAAAASGRGTASSRMRAGTKRIATFDDLVEGRGTDRVHDVRGPWTRYCAYAHVPARTVTRMSRACSRCCSRCCCRRQPAKPVPSRRLSGSPCSRTAIRWRCGRAGRAQPKGADPARARPDVEQPAGFRSAGARAAAIGDGVVRRAGVCGLRRGSARLRRDAARRHRLADAEARRGGHLERAGLDRAAAPDAARPALVGWSRGAAMAAMAAQSAPARAVRARAVRLCVRSRTSQFVDGRGRREAADGQEHAEAAASDFISPKVTPPAVMQAFVAAGAARPIRCWRISRTTASSTSSSRRS